MGVYQQVITAGIETAKIASDCTLTYLSELSMGDWCAVQVRRGDYVGNPDFDVVPFSYYEDAIARTRVAHPKMRFIVFSDDPIWCLGHPLLKNMLIHGIEAEPGSADALYLMSHCSCHIIANSSYGWWGSFLAGREVFRRVTMPSQWFRGTTTEKMRLTPRHLVA